MKAITAGVAILGTALACWTSANAEPIIESYGVVTLDAFSSVTGGQDSGTAALVLFDVGASLDLDGLVGWENTSFDFNFFNLQGESPTGEFIGDSFAVSNLDSDFDNPRLFEAALKTESLDGSLQLAVGQMAVDSDFFGSEVSGLFTNAAFGWAPAGIQSAGPAYAQASLGVLVKWQVSEKSSYMSGLYSTDIEDPDGLRAARHGLNWHFPSKGAQVWFHEFGHALNSGDFAADLKLGGWFEEGEYESAFGTDRYSKNTGYYAVIDRIRIRNGDVEGFARFATSPTDRNTYKGYFDFGIAGKSPFSFRPNDVWGIAVCSSRLSSGFDAIDTSEGEGVVELAWQANIGEKFMVQPVFQRVLNPGAAEGETVDDALVFGLRMQATW